ncbi:MAG: hypothetical protein LBR11_10160 [Deltaproteobacteria bacterium]|nr:hypothetical protein [Deltaproteobacteria bacterium]
MKVLRNEAEAESLAAAALGQILARGYANLYKIPVLLGLALKESKRAITAWKVKGLTVSPGR